MCLESLGIELELEPDDFEDVLGLGVLELGVDDEEVEEVEIELVLGFLSDEYKSSRREADEDDDCESLLRISCSDAFAVEQFWQVGVSRKVGKRNILEVGEGSGMMSRDLYDECWLEHGCRMLGYEVDMMLIYMYDVVFDVLLPSPVIS